MATTLYFALNTASNNEPGTYPVAATNYASVTPDRVLTTEGYMIPYPWRAVANLTQSSVNRTTAQTAKFGRFFSAPFAADYTYQHPLNSTDAIQYYLADYESNLSANHCIEQCFIFVWRPSTGAMVGVIQPVTTKAIGSKEPTAINSIQSTRGSHFAGAAGTIDILKGDILVFEPFATFTQAAATAYTIRFYYGGATEITAENTVVTTPASKVVFSVDLPLEMPIGAVTGSMLYTAVNELRGARLTTYAASQARLATSKLVDGSPFVSKLKAKATVTTGLTTRTLLSASLKSISKVTAWRQQEHPLSVTLRASAAAFATFPDHAVGEALGLYYSHTGTANNPSLSLGGKRGPSMAGVAFTSAPNLPGVEILSVHRMPAGTHRLRFDAAAQTVALILVERVHSYKAALGPGVTTVVVGSERAGFVVVRVDRAAVTSSDVLLQVSPQSNTLFQNPSPGAIAAGETLFRCLYLHNHTDQEVTNVVLEVSDTAPDNVGIASEFVSDVSLVGHSASQMPRTTNHKALDPTGWGGVFAMEGLPHVASEMSVNSLPIIISTPPSTIQASDGDTVQVPMVIDDEHDSQGRLSGLSFGPSLAWARIPPRRGVTFWVRKVQPPIVPGDNAYSALFRITADF